MSIRLDPVTGRLSADTAAELDDAIKGADAYQAARDAGKTHDEAYEIGQQAMADNRKARIRAMFERPA